MTTKEIEGWLIVDWKTGKHRTRKSEPDRKSLGKNELVAKLNINVNVPEVDITELAVDINVPEPHVRAATLEALDEEQLPEWTRTANELIELEEEIPDDHQALMDVVNRVAMKTMMQTNTRPDPNDVSDYVYDTLKEMSNEDAY